MKSKRELGIKTPKAPRRRKCGCWYREGEITSSCLKHKLYSYKKQENEKPFTLPKRKWHNPIARIVCWQCKKYNRPLKVLKDEKEKKTEDYVCDQCSIYGRPSIGNQSRIYFQYEKEEI